MRVAGLWLLRVVVVLAVLLALLMLGFSFAAWRGLTELRDWIWCVLALPADFKRVGDDGRYLEDGE